MSFLFANLPLSIAHFVLFIYVARWLGHPGYWLARTLGAVNGSILWWAVMVINSLFWGGCITQILLPLLKKKFKVMLNRLSVRLISKNVSTLTLMRKNFSVSTFCSIPRSDGLRMISFAGMRLILKRSANSMPNLLVINS